MNIWQVLIGAFFGALLGQIGTEVAKKLFLRSERQSAHRDFQLEKCIEHIDAIEECATRYWSAQIEPATPELYVAIAHVRAGLHALGEETAELFSGYAELIDYCEGDISRFRKTATGGNFAADDPEIDQERITQIQASAHDLRRALKRRRLDIR